MIIAMIGATEIILICAVVLLIFGGKKLPELMKGVGKGVRSFKEGMAEPSEEELQRRVKEETDRRVEAELQRRAEEGLSCTHADGETEPVNNT
ncbi:MAG: twin-arginine translocase TatA/TatE family subunit, partial [Muribaculaceae bacterium]|nr:twin-arginine translocase TatA/TatE family subunit [Muribaculaceae bacterium]